MAKQPTLIQNVLSILNGGFKFTGDKNTRDVVTSARVVSDTERDRLMSLSMRSDKPIAATNNGSGGFLVHAQKMLRSVAHDKIENSRILDMAPEVSQAASIMIPSILSPNDLRSTAIQFTSNCNEISKEKNDAIEVLITDYFEKEMSFSTLVPKWCHEALYVSGAKPLLVLPLVTLQEDFLTGPGAVISQESFDTRVRNFDQQNLYDISDYAPVNKNGNHSRIVSATESFTENNMLGLVDNTSKIKDRDSFSRNTDAKTAYEKIVSSVLAQEALTIIDNPSSIQFSHTRTKEAKDKITKRTKLRYKESTLDIVKTPEDANQSVGNPLFMQLPSESVIPVYTPGDPSDHIGYFVLLNELGHPLEITPDMAESLSEQSSYSPNQSTFQQLFQAYGMSDLVGNDSRSQNTMADIYQNIVESHLRDRMTSAGFGNIGIGKDNNIYRYMFSRYLQQRRTKLLFVPKELMTYFCFKYNEYGIGESKLNELKFILSLRISLIVCRMLVAFNNAIDRKKIEITYDSGFSGNVIEHLRAVQREAMRKSAVSFSHDPMAVAQQVVNKSYTVKARNIPGLQDYDVVNEPNQKNDANPDDQLAEDLKNMLILKLEVPAAAMNNLGEFEYSRSVNTTNLFFSRATTAKQKIVVEHINDVTRTYITYSKELREAIKKIINTKHQDGITPDGDANIIDIELFDKVIAGISATLPSPNVAPDKAQYDALDGMLSSIDGVLNAVLSNELADGDQELGSVITTMRALTKSQLVKKYITDFGFADLDLPNLDDIDQKAIIELRHTLTNIAKGLKQQEAVLNKDNPPEAPAPDMGGNTFQEDQDLEASATNQGFSGEPDDGTGEEEPPEVPVADPNNPDNPNTNASL